MPRVLVLHRSYGCESGCCGHVVEVDGEEKDFNFSHPYGSDIREFAERAALASGCDPRDLDFDSCVVSDC